MKASIAKWLIIIPSLLFLDWIILIVLGCISNLCGATIEFYCTIYCYFGITLISFTLLFIFYLIYNQITHNRIKI